MIEVEIQQSRIDAEQTRKCYEFACDQFGLKNPGNFLTAYLGDFLQCYYFCAIIVSDIWMDYVKFELDHGTKTLVTGIYARASKTMESAHSEKFMQMYGDLQTSVL